MTDNRLNTPRRASMTSPIADRLADDVIHHRPGGIAALIEHAKALEAASNAEIGGEAPLSTAQEAEMLVSGPRQDDYGDVTDSFDVVARLWAPILGLDLVSAGQVAACMVALKIARNLSGGPKHDSFVDMVGYTLLWEQVEGSSDA